MSNLKPIEQHEKEFWDTYSKPERESKCGIECPNCKEELYVDNTCVLLSDPSQRRVRCKNCKYVGSIH